jgi:transcriptional regulator with PAS, ATPase and Fis domain
MPYNLTIFNCRVNNEKNVVVSNHSKGRFLEWHITPLGFVDGNLSMILAQVEDVTQRKQMEKENLSRAIAATAKAKKLVAGLRKEIVQQATFSNMVSRTDAMQKIFTILPQIAEVSTTVLITGESGTGKELIARSLHTLSTRKDCPFVAINCSALPDNLLESELFGYKAGAFTDAKKDKPGKFALAEGGTLFLDEIGDISMTMQAKLLRVLQEKTFEPLGDTKTVHADVRVVAATNKDLSKMVKEGAFREDLFYRVKVLYINLPSLRERKSDIPLLCEHFIERFNTRFEKNVREISPEALDVLLLHEYPGNIRELENVMEHAFIFCKDSSIQPVHLPPELSSPVPLSTAVVSAEAQSFEDVERAFIRKTLTEVHGNRNKAAEKLGIHKATLFRKLRSLGIDDV